MALSAGDLAWVRSKVGSEPPDADLNARYDRLGSRADVAREVLSERKANMLVGPAKLDVDGEYSEDRTETIRALERALADPELYDDVGDDTTTPGDVRIIPTAPRRRR